MIIATEAFWWVWLLVVGLLSVFIYLDFKSRPTSLRPLRISAMVLGLASLLGLYLNPSIQKDATLLKVVIQSTGSNVQTVDSLIQAGFVVAENVEMYQEILKSSAIEELVIAGDGLEVWELKEIKQPFKLLAGEPETEGPFELEIREGVVQTTLPIEFRMLLRDSMLVNLSGPGIEKSGKSVAATDKTVSFSVVPSVAGYLKYQLDGVRGDDTVFSEIVPVKVLDRSKTNVLMLGVAPNFEYRFLKNYLAEEGFGIAERIQISKDVFRDSFTNMKRMSLRNLSTTTLSEFQLVIMDAYSYNALRAGEKNDLKTKLRNGELGIIWSSNEVANDLVKTRSVQKSKLEIASGSTKIELATSDSELAGNGENLLFQSQAVGEVMQLGLGKIVLPSVTNSYSLILKGEADIYGQLWRELLQPAVGSEWTQDRITVSSFPRVDEPTSLEVVGLPLDQFSVDSVRLAVNESWFRADTWTTTYWPKKTGWNAIDETSLKFFVFDSTDWSNERKLSKQARNREYGRSTTRETEAEKKVYQPISKWIFFLIFLISFGFLWLEQRIR